MPQLEIVQDVAGAAAERIATAVRAGGHIALAGGSTPRRAHELVAAVDGLDFSRTELWFGDDRAVGPEDENSNYLMARESLLDRLTGPGPVVHRICGELGFEAAARDYDDELHKTFGDGPPRIDLVLLGLGPDAHTASLFPGKPALNERERWVAGVPEPGMDPRVPRVTLTYPALDAAAEVLFVISGQDKADAVLRAFGPDPDPEAPAGQVSPTSGKLTVLLDPPAASALPQETS